MDPVIDAQGVTYEYPRGTQAIQDIDLTIEPGERIAIVGSNGSGKSTLQLVLGGLLAPTIGTIEYFGDTTDPESIRDRVGVLLQDPDNYLFNATVREDIEYGPAQLGLDREDVAHRIEMLTDELGLTELLDRPPFRLSGGEKQRAAVASVLSFDPDVLLLDEPLGAVDSRYRKRIKRLLNEYNGTVVLFTPSLDVVPEVASRVILLDSTGAIIADNCVQKVLTDDRLLGKEGLKPPILVQLFKDHLDDDEIPLTVADGRGLLSKVDEWDP